MKTLYEQIINQPDEFFYAKKLKFSNGSVKEGLDKSEIFKIDNVGQYYMESEQLDWDWDCFPNIAPPFENFYMEYTPPALYRCIEGDFENKYFRKEGALFMSHVLEGKNAPYKWMYTIMLFAQYKNKVAMEPCFVRLYVCEDGSIYGKEGERLVVGVILGEHFSDLDPQLVIDFAFNKIRPFLLAISFLHCRNVSITVPTNAHKISGRDRYKPRFIFKTLEIEPMKKVLLEEGGSDKNGLKQAFHICRGHFKTFKEKPLFGKISGTFWWDSQVRGSISSGMTIKDYSINPPKEKVLSGGEA